MIKNQMELALEPFLFMNKSILSDGEGGHITTWSEGAEFEAVAAFPDQTNAEIADYLTARLNCWIWTKKDVVLEPMQVIKRVRDGQTFRIRGGNKEEQTPPTSSLDMSRVKAEKWEIPVSE